VAEAVWQQLSTFIRDIGMARQAVCQRVLVQELDGVIQRQPGRHARCLQADLGKLRTVSDAWVALHAAQHMPLNAHLQIIRSHDDELVRCQFDRCVRCDVVYVAIEHLT
jgi:hypothetical protein